MIFDLWPHPKGHQFDPRIKFLLVFCSARHPHWIDIPHDHVWKKWPPWAPPAPQSPTPWAWPRGQNEILVWYVLYRSFVRTHTKFGIQIFEIDFVIEIKWYLTFWLLRAPGVGAKKKFDAARPIHVSSSHTKFGWISSNGLGGDSITDRRTNGRTDRRTDRQTDGGNYKIPSAFLKCLGIIKLVCAVRIYQN